MLEKAEHIASRALYFLMALRNMRVMQHAPRLDQPGANMVLHKTEEIDMAQFPPTCFISGDILSEPLDN